MRDGLPVAIPDRSRAGHHAARHDLDQKGRPARRKHLAVFVANDPACGRESYAPNDVLVRDRRVVAPAQDLKLEQPNGDRGKRRERRERHPFVTTTKLSDRRPRREALRQSETPARSVLGEPPDIECTAWASRNTRGATAAVAIACGSA